MSNKRGSGNKTNAAWGLLFVVLLAVYGVNSYINSKTPDTPKTGTAYEYNADVSFRNADLLNEHYNKHGREMGFTSPESYEDAARSVVNNPSALHKYESEDGDDVYYLESSNDFVIVSVDGYIRTYYKPRDGKAYFDRQ